MGADSSLIFKPFEETGSQISHETVSSGQSWVTISPFVATISGQKTNVIAGYLSGDRNGATITIAGKRSSDSDFSDITTIKPDENGLFLWAVTTGHKDLDLFRITARTSSTAVQSNAVRFTVANEGPTIKPDNSLDVVSFETKIPTLVQTLVPTPSGGSSQPALTSLSISTSMTDPQVGESFLISGRLTDRSGNGVGGATITIDEAGYSGSDPLSTTQTDSDGSFEFSVGVSYAYTVGFVAHYQGDENYNRATSNTLTFTAH